MESGCCSLPSAQNRAKNRLKLNEYTPLTGAGGDIISEYIAQKDVAPWFRGTSHYHIKGASMLFNALRDDLQQETTHRVKTCLTLIGLKPMITSKQIKFLMILSRGNDLVFLWFLMEKHYKTPKDNPKSYSQNEQLICSAICHLDTVPTLRELDRVLPLGPTSKVPAKKPLPKHQEATNPTLGRRKKLPAKKFVLPYFMKQRPPEHYGKPLYLKRPNFIVQFKYYSKFNDPHFRAPNEENRWFANYEFNIGRRVSFMILNEILRNIFECSKDDYVKLKTADVLCGYHDKMKRIKINLLHQHKLKIRDMIFKHCARYNDNEFEKRMKIREMLEQAAQKQLCIIKKKLSRPDTLKTITSDCRVFDSLLGANECAGDSGKCEQRNNSKTHREKRKKNSNRQHETPCFDFHGTYFRGSREIFRSEENETENNPGPTNSNSRHKLNNNEANAFFKCPTGEQPYKFDYRKIFSNLEGFEEIDIRKLILKALKKNTSRLPVEKEQSEPTYRDAVENGIDKIFDKEVEDYEAARIAEAEAQGRSSALAQYPPHGKYDPEDFALMDKMLFDAFQHLRKDPKFVWAQLPEAHKMPYLREWIARRYGKEYTPKERYESFKSSCVVYRALERNEPRIPLPTVTQIGKKNFVDYACRDYVRKKVQHIKNGYYQHLDAHLLEHVRVFWFAMRGYICSNGPPRKSFFAYMPSRLADIQHFRVWKSYEFRNQWSAWNRRQQKQKSL